MGHSSINGSLTYLRGLEVPELKEEDITRIHKKTLRWKIIKISLNTILFARCITWGQKHYT